MNTENTNNIKESNETNVEEFEIVTTKRTEIDKEKFFKLMAKHEELTLTIDRIGKVGKSKYRNNEDLYPYGCFIDYIFSVDKVDYEIGIYYNLGVPISEKKFKLTSGMNIFKIIGVATDISKAEEITVTEEFIQDTLTGVTFLAEIGTSYNGGFLIEPISLID